MGVWGSKAAFDTAIMTRRSRWSWIKTPTGLRQPINFQQNRADRGQVAVFPSGGRQTRSTVMNQIAALRSRLEKQLTDPATAGGHHHYMRDGALAKDTIPKGIPTWNLSFGIHWVNRRFPEAMFTMLNNCYELG